MSTRPALATVRRLPLLLLPAEFRREYGADVLEVLYARLQQQRRLGPVAWLRYALFGAYDYVTTALRLRLTDRHPGLPPLRPRTTGTRTPPTRSPLSNWTPDMLLRDFRFALRALVHRPLFAGIVTLTLALGIGANVLIYSAVDAVVLNPFDFREPDRVVTIGTEFPRLNRPLGFFEVLSAPEYSDIRDQSQTLETIVGFDMGNRQITGGEIPENLRTGFWWGDPLPTIAMTPVVGRSITQQDIQQEEAVALISERVWRTRFAADPEVVGSTIRINDDPYTLIGVFPNAAIFYGIDLWTPMWAKPEVMPRGRRQFNIIARTREGVSLAEVNTELETIARRTELAYGAELDEYTDWRLEAMTWTDAAVRTMRPAAMVLLGAVGFVLLLVCANVASLLLARSASRRREIAVRAALGAGRARIIRQLLSENMVLAIIGGIAGIGLAWIGLRWLGANTPAGLLPTTRPLGINLRVLGYTGFISLLSGLLFGLAPALQTARFDLQRTLNLESGQSTGSRARRRLHGVFVAVEVALALALLVGAGLFITSFARLQRVDPGIDTTNGLTMRLTLPASRFQGEAIANFFVELAERVESIPGVRSAASTSQYPPMGFTQRQFSLPDQVVESESELPTALLTIASADYFETLGIPLLRGRTFNDLDLPGTDYVTVVNQTFASRHYGAANPIGKRFKLGTPQSEDGPWLSIVGVVDDTRNAGLQAPPRPEFFVGLRQVNGVFNQLFLVVRTDVEPRTLLPAIREQVAAIDPEQPIYAIRTLEETFAQAFAMQSFAMTLLSAFGVMALVLAAVGIFGVVSYSVSERTREIGVRLALGAGGAQVRRLVIRQALLPVAIGAIIGLGLALAIGKLLSGFLYAITGADPFTVALVGVTLAAVATLASYLPARRASSIDPLVALRND